MVPQGVVTTGWPAVAAQCREFGVTFRPWQVPVGRLILGKRGDGKYAATVGGCGLSIPRQVGKTFLVGMILFALCLLRPGLTVIWTAHRLRTAEETFAKLAALAQRRRIKPYVAKVLRGSGDESILFHNGSRILFGARERGFGRGFDEVDVVVFDEAQILSDGALDDMIPATNQSRQETSALMLFMGTPPKPTDPSESFTRMRTEALSGEDTDTAWVEFGADDDYIPTSAPDPMTAADWAQLAKANPSFPDDTPREAILRMRKKLGPESMVREGFGIWDPVNGGGALNYARWLKLIDPSSQMLKVSAFGVDTTPDQGNTSISAVGLQAGPLADPKLHGEMIRNGAGLGWAKQACLDLDRDHGPAVFVLPSVGPAAALIDDLTGAGLDVRVANAADTARAYTDLVDAITAGSIVAGPQEPLSTAVQQAKKRKLGDGGATLGRDVSSDVDISPAVSLMLAHWAVKNPLPSLVPINNVW